MMQRIAALAGAAALMAVPALGQEVPALQAPGAQGGVIVRGGGGNQASSGQAAGPTMPNGWPGEVSALSPDRPLSRREVRNLGMATRWRLRACTPTQRPDGVLEFLQGACEITVVCAPLRVCVIALEPGETVTDLPDVGDPRWMVQRRVVGAGAQRTINAVVKPADAGLDTTLTIPTNKRILAIRLISRRNEYMPYVTVRDGGGASSSMRQEWGREVALGARAAAPAASPCDQQPIVPPSAYRISVGGWGQSSPSWAPTQAYVVQSPSGPTTCLDFPADIGSADLPALVAFDGRGTERVVTARWTGRRYAVDGAHARLAVIGAGFERVNIDRKGAR